MVKHLIKFAGLLTAIGWNGWLVWDNFITVEQELGVKIGFGGMLASLVLILVGFGKINRHIGRKLQAIETAKELNAVGRTSTWYATALQWVGVVTPLALIGGLFYFVEHYFQGAGATILQMTGILGIPVATTLIYNVMDRNQTIKKEHEKQQALIRGVASELEARKVVGYQ